MNVLRLTWRRFGFLLRPEASHSVVTTMFHLRLNDLFNHEVSAGHLSQSDFECVHVHVSSACSIMGGDRPDIQSEQCLKWPDM